MGGISAEKEKADTSWHPGRLNPLLEGIMSLPLHEPPVAFMDGEVLCLFPEGFSQNKMLTYRGGVVVAERKLLPAKGWATDVDKKPAVCAHLGIKCGVVCRWSKIIRSRWNGWFGVGA